MRKLNIKMRDLKVIAGAAIVCLISALAPPLLNWLCSSFSEDCMPFVYSYLSEIQFLVSSLFVFSLLLGGSSSSKIWRWILLVLYLMQVPLLVVSLRGLDITKIEISLCSALVILIGVYVVNLLRIKKNRMQRISDPPDEELGRTRYYKSGIQLIRKNAALDHPIHKSAFALLSPWGNGKTHFVQYIKANLRAESKQKKKDEYNGRFRTCEVSLWESKTLDEAWVNIINALYSSVTDSVNQNKISELPGTIFSFILRIGGVFSSNLSNLSTIIEIVTEAGKYDIESKASTIDKKLGEERALLILEDVDRAPYEIIRGLLPLIERLKNISKLSVICSMDVEEVAKLYKATHNIDEETLRGYLFKVFDYTFILPEMSPEMMQKKVKASAGELYSDCRLLNLFVNEIELHYDSPRQMERMLDEWAYVERNFLPINPTSELSSYTKEEAFVIFVSKAMSICAPRETKELLDKNDILKEISEMVSENNDSFDTPCSLKDGFSVHNATLYASCINFFREHKTALRTFREAVHQKYARRVDITDFECEDLITLSLKQEQKEEIGVLLDDYFRDAPLEPHSRIIASYHLFDHAIQKFASPPRDDLRAHYHEFLLKILEKQPFSDLTYESSYRNPFTIFQRNFEACLGFLLIDREKYQRLLDLLFDKMSYYDQAIACLRLHLVYNPNSSEYFSRENVSQIFRLVFEARDSVAYKSIIRRYVSKFAARFCQYLMSPCLEETSATSFYVSYLYMDELFAPSLDVFNERISSWIKENPEKKSKLGCGFLSHLLTKVWKASMYRPCVYIPKGIIQHLPSIFNVFRDFESLTFDEQKEIREMANYVMNKLQEGSAGPPFGQNSLSSGAPEVIEYIQASLFHKNSENVKKV